MPKPSTTLAPGESAEDHAILRALRRKVRPYDLADLAAAAQVRKPTVRRRLRALMAAGLVCDREAGVRTLYDLGPNAQPVPPAR